MDNLLSYGEHEGFSWAILHNGMGYRCGYVRVPEGHPWFGRDYDEIEPPPPVHGGLTYAAPQRPGDEPDGGWWVGFDCAHAGDAQDPGLPTKYTFTFFPDDVVRDEGYVQEECLTLCGFARTAREKE